MRPKRKISLRPMPAALLLAGTAIAGATGATALADTDTRAAAVQRLQAPPAAAVARAGSHSSLADMVEAVGPSVVQIDARSEGRAIRTPFGLLQERSRESVGSGFIIDASGIVITNNHVVDGSTTVKVKLSDGSERSARVLGRDPKTDLAVLRIEGGGRFQPVQWGDSDRIRVGESVFAVGSPFGLGNSVTSGIISARGREIGAGPYDDFLQVDAAINSGNSGGPLFDAAGRVVGVNTAMFSPTGGNVGIGFAIPARMAQNIARQVVENGAVSRGRVGVGLQDVTPEVTRAQGIAEQKGALIAQVEPDGPAAAAGLASGDIVRSFAGKPVDDGRDFARLVADARIGSVVPITVIRDNRKLTLNLRIGSDRG